MKHNWTDNIESINSIASNSKSIDPDGNLFNDIIWHQNPQPYHEYFFSSMAVEYLQMAIDDSDEFWQMINRNWHLIIIDELSGQIGYALAGLHRQNNKTPYILMR